MSAYTVQIKGTHPNQNDLTNDDAAETASSIVEHLESKGHTVHHVSVNHGNLKGGTYDHFERLNKEKATSPVQVPTEIAAEATEAAT